MTIQIKDWKVLKGLMVKPYHHKMIGLAEWVTVRFSEVMFTSAFRPGTGVHGTDPCRGLDIRSWIYNDPKKVVSDINTHWIYDPKRPEKKCAVLHAICPKCGHNNSAPYHEKCDKCGTNIKYYFHLHMQVHDRTQYLREGE